MAVTYPYQRLRLPCGCHEIVTGPGAVDVHTCREHPEEGALSEARADCFLHLAKGAADGERAACIALAREMPTPAEFEGDEPGRQLARGIYRRVCNEVAHKIGARVSAADELLRRTARK